MNAKSASGHYHVPGIGTAVVHPDGTRLASTVPAGELLSSFPIQELRQASHDCSAEQRRRWRRSYMSNILVVCGKPAFVRPSQIRSTSAWFLNGNRKTPHVAFFMVVHPMHKQLASVPVDLLIELKVAEYPVLS